MKYGAVRKFSQYEQLQKANKRFNVVLQFLLACNCHILRNPENFCANKYFIERNQQSLTIKAKW